jgi:hypothetical protein
MPKRLCASSSCVTACSFAGARVFSAASRACANYERAVRELPAANLSITLPILLVGLEQDEHTPVVDVRECRFGALKEIIGKGNTDNRWRVINGYISGVPMSMIGPESDTGPKLDTAMDEDEAAVAADAPAPRLFIGREVSTRVPPRQHIDA